MIIETDSPTKDYPMGSAKVQALRGVDVLEDGEVVVVGISASGKGGKLN